MMWKNDLGFRMKGLRQFKMSMKFGSTAELRIVGTTVVFFFKFNYNRVLLSSGLFHICKIIKI